MRLPKTGNRWFVATSAFILTLLLSASALAQSGDYVSYAKSEAPSASHAVDALTIALSTLDERARIKLARELRRDKAKGKGSKAFLAALDEDALETLLKVPRKPDSKKKSGSKKPQPKCKKGSAWCL